jgi:hypothetical protein
VVEKTYYYSLACVPHRSYYPLPKTRYSLTLLLHGLKNKIARRENRKKEPECWSS